MFLRRVNTFYIKEKLGHRRGTGGIEITEDTVRHGAELYAMDMTVGLSDHEIDKINALRSDLRFSWKELLDKIQMVFSDRSLNGPEVDRIDSLKLELNLTWSELLKKVCLMELMMVMKEE